MALSKHVARSLGADLYIVSAGLGLVHESELVPNYDFTASTDAGPLQTALELSGKPLTSWWAVLTRRSSGEGSLADIIQSTPSRLVLVALPASYLRLVAADLAAVGKRASERLRVFTSEAGRAEAPARIRHCVLPYNGNLESLDGFNGTRAEFPQRALRHFIVEMGGHKLSLRDAHARVTSALAELTPRIAPVRQRCTDEQITELIRASWTLYAGCSTRLHRYLRDEALVACEQSRFRLLWRQIRAEYEGKKGRARAT